MVKQETNEVENCPRPGRQAFIFRHAQGCNPAAVLLALRRYCSPIVVHAQNLHQYLTMIDGQDNLRTTNHTSTHLRIDNTHMLKPVVVYLDKRWTYNLVHHQYTFPKARYDSELKQKQTQHQHPEPDSLWFSWFSR